MKKEKKLHLKKIKIASFVTLLNDEEKKKINGGTKMASGTTFLRIFC
jgi:hypothetical protein